MTYGLPLYLSDNNWRQTVSAWTGGRGIDPTTSPYNADNTGVKDVQGAFSSAIADLAAAGGGRLLIPPGSFRLASKLVTTASQIEIEGAGPSLSRIVGDFNGDDIVCFGDGSANPNFCSISNLRIDGGSTTRTSGAAVRFRNGYRMACRNVYTPVNHYTSLQLDGGSGQFIYEVHDCLFATGSYGIRIGVAGGLTQDSRITNTTIGGQTVAGMDLNFMSGGYFDSVSILSCGLGISSQPGANQYATANFFNSTITDGSTAQGWLLKPSSASGSISDWNITNSWGSNNGAEGAKLDANGGKISGVAFDAFRAVDNQTHGINLFDAREVTMANCHVLCNSQAGLGTYHGLTVAAGVSRFSVTGGIYGIGGRLYVASGTNKQGYGIVVNAGTSDNYAIQGVIALGNVTASISDGGTGVNKSVTGNII